MSHEDLGLVAQKGTSWAPRKHGPSVPRRMGQRPVSRPSHDILRITETLRVVTGSPEGFVTPRLGSRPQRPRCEDADAGTSMRRRRCEDAGTSGGQPVYEVQKAWEGYSAPRSGYFGRFGRPEGDEPRQNGTGWQSPFVSLRGRARVSEGRSQPRLPSGAGF